jgi:hypothetical protein
MYSMSIMARDFQTLFLTDIPCKCVKKIEKEKITRMVVRGDIKISEDVLLKQIWLHISHQLYYLFKETGI